MYVMILNILAYGHDALMGLFYYSRTLGRRYSMKATALAAAGWWAAQSVCKLPAMYLADDYDMTLIMTGQLVLMIVYLFIFYKSSPARKLLSFMLMAASLGMAEFTSVLIAANIFEIGDRPLQLGSEFTVAGLLIMRPLATLAYYIAFQIWNALQRSSWIHGSRQWLCVILPLSQVFLLWYLTEAYTEALETLPAPVLAGVFLAAAADIYMFVVFDQAQQREDMENELRLKKHLFQLEQIRYEKLRSSLEETARLRHDYQNYLLALRGMPAAEPETEDGGKGGERI